MKKIQIALLTVLTAVLMTACFESKDVAADLASQVAGEYEMLSVATGGKTYTLAEYVKLGGAEGTFLFTKIDATTLRAESFTIKNGVKKSDNDIGTIKLTDLGGGSIKLDDATTPNVGGTITYKDGQITFLYSSGNVIYKKK